VTPEPGRAARPEPPADETTLPFWEATRDKRLLVQWCDDCGRAVFFPREVCPFCTSSRLVWKEAGGSATLYSFTVEHRPQIAVLGRTGPYVIGLVDLEEGVRMMSNVVSCPPDALAVGMALRVTWEPLGDGRHLPLFEPVDGAPPPSGSAAT
jgi:uncharacterized protein